MADHLTYEQKIKGVYKGLILLAVITLVEVGISLFGKGHLGFTPTATWILAIVGLLLIALSIYKAYYIIYEFMHLGHEVSGLRMTVLLPMLLLVWALIAFFNEGKYWGDTRAKIQEKNNIEIQEGATGMLKYREQTKNLH